jgi:hypothetical protein
MDFAGMAAYKKYLPSGGSCRKVFYSFKDG